MEDVTSMGLMGHGIEETNERRIYIFGQWGSLRGEIKAGRRRSKGYVSLEVLKESLGRKSVLGKILGFSLSHAHQSNT